MKQTLMIALALSTVASLAGCKKKDDAGKTDKPTTAKPTDKPTDKPADPPPPPPAAAAVEVDLTPWGPAFAGYVAMAPAGTKVVFDDPSRQLTISDTDYVSVSEAEFWADGVKTLPTDPDNSDIKNVSDTEVRWMRNPPLGKQWNFDTKLDVGGKAYSCNGNTFTDAAMSDKLVAICKSIKKK